MADLTVNDRIKKQREARLLERWQEVRVWVPTDEDAKDVQALAADRRAKAEDLAGLLEGIKSMENENLKKTIEAIASQGSAAYTTPSGPVLTLLSDLAAKGSLGDFARAFIIFARAKPANAAFVAESAPAKILNQYFLRYLKLSATSFHKWETSNADWAQRIKAHLRDVTAFEDVVGEMATSIKKAA